MEATGLSGQHSDEQLAERAAAGDRRALAALYERYFQGIHDFIGRTTRSPDLAADVVQNTFIKAWDSLRKGKRVANVKAWLFTIARNSAIDELRRGERLVALDDRDGEDETAWRFAEVDTTRLASPEEVVRDKELVELVWTSASALSSQEYSLLDLHVRQGLSPDELADALEVGKGAIYTRLSRLRDSLEDSVTTTLLMRGGRRECSELDALLTELRATRPTRDVRSAVQRHLADCSTCQESKRRYVAPAEILAAFAPLPAASGVRENVWEGVSSGIEAGAPGQGPPEEAHPTLRARPKVGRTVLAAAAIAAVVLIGGALATTPASGHLTGGCTVTADSGVDATTVVDTSRSAPFVIDLEGSLTYEATTPVPFRNSTWRVWVYVGGFRMTLDSGEDPNEGGATVEGGRVRPGRYLDRIPGIGRVVGIYRVGGEISGDGGSCSGTAYVRISGNPLESGPGRIGAFLLGLGLAGLVTSGLPRRGKGPGKGGRGRAAAR